MTISELFDDVTHDDLLNLYRWLEFREPPCNAIGCTDTVHRRDCDVAELIRLLDFTGRAILQHEEVNRFEVQLDV